MEFARTAFLADDSYQSLEVLVGVVDLWMYWKNSYQEITGGVFYA